MLTLQEQTERNHLIDERDSSRKAALCWGLACVFMFVALVWVCRHPADTALECPAPGVMQLDPTTVRARATESVEL